MDGGPEALRARVDELLQAADTVAEELHRLAVNLRPSSLDRYGLVPALEQLLTEFRKQTGLEVGFQTGGLEELPTRLPGAVETALYRIVQESLTNIARYAQASLVSVIVQSRDDWVQVVVEDDGRGFDVEEALAGGRLGILGMRERAEMLGGTLEIESGPGQGATIYANLPARQAAAGDAPEPARSAWATSPAAAEKALEIDPRLAEAAELARAKALSDALVDLTAGMARQPTARDLLAFVLARSTEAIGCDSANVFLREGDHWFISEGYGQRQALIGRRLSDAESPIALQVERSGQVVVLDDTRSAGQLAAGARRWGVSSTACIPLVAAGQFLGVVGYAHDAARIAFKPSEVNFLKRLASLVSLAMENVHLHEVEAHQRDELAQRVEDLESLTRQLQAAPRGRGTGARPARSGPCRFTCRCRRHRRQRRPHCVGQRRLPRAHAPPGGRAGRADR